MKKIATPSGIKGGKTTGGKVTRPAQPKTSTGAKPIAEQAPAKASKPGGK
jgi:hypothetical protein